MKKKIIIQNNDLFDMLDGNESDVSDDEMRR